MPTERRRLSLAFLLSLLLHALLLSLAFGGGEGLGLPGLAFPWQQRWIEAPSLQVVLPPAPQIAPVPLVMPSETPAPVRQDQAATEPTSPLPGAFSSSLRHAAKPATPDEPARAESKTKTRADTGTPTDPVATPASPPAEIPARAVPVPPPHTPVIALEQSDDKSFVVPPPPPEPASGTAALPDAHPLESTEPPPPPDAVESVQSQVESETGEQTADTTQADLARHEAQRLADRQEAVQLEAERREAERLVAEKLETQHRETARQEAARAEAARQEVERREADRLAAEKLEAQHREAARQEAARAEAARQEVERREAERLAAEKLEAQRREAARQEAAHAEAERQEAARAEAARQEAERREAARLQEAREEEEKRLARRRAMGRQLDEEAAQRQAAATRPPLPLSLSTARRVRLWGRSDPNVELVLYAEAWVRRIQLNTPADTVRQLAGRRHAAPMVTVAVRSDGSVEAVTLVVSSGVPEVDEAIRRIVQNNVPYPPFPPVLARQYDVVEIRRTWHFDTAIRLD